MIGVALESDMCLRIVGAAYGLICAKGAVDQGNRGHSYRRLGIVTRGDCSRVHQLQFARVPHTYAAREPALTTKFPLTGRTVTGSRRSRCNSERGDDGSELHARGLLSTRSWRWPRWCSNMIWRPSDGISRCGCSHLSQLPASLSRWCRRSSRGSRLRRHCWAGGNVHGGVSARRRRSQSAL
jgi:hypothetical protein